MSSENSGLTEFLRDHGLESYANALAEQAVDLQVLPHLTLDEFKELGLPLGDRRKLEIAASGLLKDIKPISNQRKRKVRSPELRQVTILFCDIVESTQLSRSLGPENFSEVLNTYSERTASAIKKFHGHVAKFLGDGVLAYFGYPNAHEDDVERAILAAREILNVLGGTLIEIEGGPPVPIKVRIGINTGPVVAGNFDGLHGFGEDLFGEAPNIAQRLLSAAMPDEILISTQTRRLAGDRFEYSALEPRVLKGTTEPIIPYKVMREFTAKTRFEAQHSGALTPFVGRTQDLDRLVGHWGKARFGVGQAVMLSGPAGIGKSRLAHAFFDEIRSEAKRIMTFQCSPHHKATALFPIKIWLDQEIGISALEDRSARLDAARDWLAKNGLADTHNLSLLASLLSIDVEGLLPSLNMTPRQRMEETLHFLVEQVAMLAKEIPVLILVEDAHWCDATTLRLLELIRELCRNRAILLLVTFRSNSEHGQPQLEIASHYRLDHLANLDAAHLVAAAAKPHRIDEQVVSAVVQRAGGNPFFAQELTKSIVKRMNAGEQLETDPVTGAPVVPASLVDSLSARLDALPTAKHLAQIAAAIGREVPQALLKTASGYADAQFQSALRELAEAEFVVSYPENPSEPLVFGHALVQDVAYRLLLKKDRRAIHAKIVRALEADLAEGLTPLPEVLARHCEAAQQIENAVSYLIAAGKNAITQSANIEALRHLEHARKLLSNDISFDAHRSLVLELEIQSAIGTPLIAVEGYTSKKTVHAFDRAEEISEQIGDAQSRFQALFGLWGHRWMAGHIDMSQRIADEMLDVAETHATLEHRIVANRCAGSSQWIMGNSAATVDYLGKVVELAQGMDTSEIANRYAVCPHVVALVLSGYLMWLGGQKDEGLGRLTEGLERAYRMNHAYSMSLSHSLMGGIGWLSGDEDKLAKNAIELHNLAERRHLAYWQSYALTLKGALLSMQGSHQEGKELVKQAIDASDKMGVFIHRTVQLIILSDIERGQGNAPRAKALLDEAEALGKRTGERQWFGVIDRQRKKLGA